MNSMTLVLQAIAVLLLSSALIFAQDWPYVDRDPGGTRHSSLRQINRGNVGKLKIAWTFDTSDSIDGKDLPSRSSFEATPLVIDNWRRLARRACSLPMFIRMVVS